MPFNAGGQTYIGGQLLAQGLGDFGKGIGGGIMEALEEQRKKQQFTDQIMLQALQSGHATPEQYLEYTKKNTKGKQDYAMTIAANFADEYKERVKEQHQKTQADIAQSNAATEYNKMLKQHQQQQIDIANQALSDPGPTPEEETRRNKYGLVTIWTPGKGFEVKDMAGSTAKTTSPYAQTDIYSQDGTKVIGKYDSAGTPHYLPAELLKGGGAAADQLTFKPLPDPNNPGNYVPGKVVIVDKDGNTKVEGFRSGKDSPFRDDPETGITLFQDENGVSHLVPGDTKMKAAISQQFLKPGARSANDAGSGVDSTYGSIKRFLFGPDTESSAASPTPTATPTATPFATPSPTPSGTPLDQIIQQMSPTPTGTPAQTATPSGTPLDQIVKKITETSKTGAKKTLTPKDRDALDWARKNPTDPRAKAILAKLGMQ